MNNSRKIAVDVIKKIISERMFFSEVKEHLLIDKLPDINFVNMLVLTTLRHRVFIKKVLQNFIKKPNKGKIRFADFAIEVAVAEILFLNTPDYAVLNSYVNLIKEQDDKYIANFANAVLRNITRKKEEILKQNTKVFFTEKFKKDVLCGYSKKEIEAIEQASVNITPLDLTVKDESRIHELNQKLGGEILPNGSIRLQNSGKVSDLYGYADGLWWVQDFAASLPVLALGELKNKKVLDLCAAPGGKTAQLISRGAQVTALDISQNRLDKLQENLQRLNLQTVNTICADAIDFLQNYLGDCFDVILLDAPCSASGTFRRHPELVHIKDKRDVDKAVLIQKQLLELSSKALKKGGYLLYTVCSIAKQEGEKQIADFLKKHQEYQLIPILQSDICRYDKNVLVELITPEGSLRTLPCYLEKQGGIDAFFAVKLLKVQ